MYFVPLLLDLRSFVSVVLCKRRWAPRKFWLAGANRLENEGRAHVVATNVGQNTSKIREKECNEGWKWWANEKTRRQVGMHRQLVKPDCGHLSLQMPNQEASRHCAHTGQIDLGLRHDTLLSEVVTLTRPIFL
jgi:hypothetical protein